MEIYCTRHKFFKKQNKNAWFNVSVKQLHLSPELHPARPQFLLFGLLTYGPESSLSSFIWYFTVRGTFIFPHSRWNEPPQSITWYKNNSFLNYTYVSVEGPFCRGPSDIETWSKSCLIGTPGSQGVWVEKFARTLQHVYVIEGHMVIETLMRSPSCFDNVHVIGGMNRRGRH